MENTRRMRGTPGPEYNPPLKPEIPNAPKFSFGERRCVPGFDPLAPQGSTPLQVGPGSYRKLDEKPTSIHQDYPKVSFTRDEKFRPLTDNPSKHQTYDTRSAIGSQVSSKNPSRPVITFGKARKDYKTGIFQSHMSTQPTRIQIKMPKF